MKKAQGISVNVIIIAAIALLVLVVLSVIFIGRMGGWGKAAGACENKGGKCINIGTGTCAAADADYPTKYTIWDCEDKTKTCCIKAGP
jgi:hypothetical protein